MTRVEVILDGATEPPGDRPTSLEAARMPAYDDLVAAGTVTWRRTVPPGLPAGTETAVPVLLGWTPPGPVDRGALEAAARGIAVPDGTRARRVDGARPADRRLLRRAAFGLHDLGRGRLLAVGSGTLPALGDEIRVWPDGVVPPRVLDHSTVVVAARGAAAGAAALLGAHVVVPPGATGDTDSDLAAKATAAIRAVEDGAPRVVVHIGAPDAAGHRRSRIGKIAALQAIDRDVLAPLRDRLARAGRGTLAVGADHGCDPATGRHDAAPVPWVEWSP